MYRPQFAYSTPPGCRDEEFTYFFDGLNTPLLNQDISGRTIENIPLVLDQDAPFYWRGWKVGAIRQWSNGVPASIATLVPEMDVKLRTPYGDDLSDGWIPATHSGFPMNPLNINVGLLTGPPVPLEPEIYCPQGGVILAFLRVATIADQGEGGTLTNFTNFTFYGVKRFKECKP